VPHTPTHTPPTPERDKASSPNAASGRVPPSSSQDDTSAPLPPHRKNGPVHSGRQEGTAARPGIVLAVTTVASFLTPFMASAANIALPSVGRTFHASAAELGWIATSYLLAAAAFLVPMGRLADLRGRRRVFILGMAIYALTSLLCGLATSSALLIAARVVQGLGGAMMFGTGIAILTAAYPKERRGWALGVNITGVYVGLSIGPFVGGLLTDTLGWRSVFFMNALIGAGATWGAVRFLRAPEDALDGPFHVGAALLYTLGCALFMVGFGRLSHPFGGAAVLGGALLLGFFVRTQLRAQTPLLDLGLFRGNRVFTFSNLAALINYTATFATGFLLSLYLQEGRHLDARHAGLILVTQPLCMAIVSPAAGRLSDRVEPRVVASLGMTLSAVGLAILIALGATTPLPYVAVCLAVLGIGFGLFSSPNTNAIMGSVPRSLYGVASSLLATGRLFGQTLSLGLATLLLSLFVGAVPLAGRGTAQQGHALTEGMAQGVGAAHGELIGGLKVAFALFALLCFGGIFASLARGSTRKE